MKNTKKKKKTAAVETWRFQKQELKGPGHYVPQFWIRGFRGANGRVLGRRRGETRARQVNISEIMAEQGAYTLFDHKWHASDVLEDLLANKHEGRVARLFRILHDQSIDLTDEMREELCFAVAIAATRLPHVMDKGFRAANKIATLLPEVHRRSYESFRRKFAAEAKTAITRKEYDDLRRLPPEQLAAEVKRFVTRVREDPVLPPQDTMLATPKIKRAICGMDFCLLDAPDESFILGDTPLPDHDLAKGFTLPLSSKLALSASPRVEKTPTFVRRRATKAKIRGVNQTQFDNFLEIVVGPNKSLLEEF
jgi:hypothetical protein